MIVVYSDYYNECGELVTVNGRQLVKINEGTIHKAYLKSRWKIIGVF